MLRFFAETKPPAAPSAKGRLRFNLAFPPPPRQFTTRPPPLLKTRRQPSPRNHLEQLLLHRLKQVGFRVNRPFRSDYGQKTFLSRKNRASRGYHHHYRRLERLPFQVEIILGASIASGNSGIKSRAGALTNFEVLDLLRSRGAGKDPTRVIASMSQSEFKVFDYLEQTAAHSQTRGVINKLVEECKKYGLAKAEILNIANIRPSSAVEVYTMIEECEKRMEDRVDELMETIVQVLPPHPSQVESNKEIVEDKS